MSVPHEMNAFLRVVEKGSFAGAAADLTLTPSAVSKIITRLEERLGVSLLLRTTRSLTLTPEGETYLRRCREILEAIEEAESEVSQSAVELRGLIRLNTFTAFGRYKIPRLLTEFIRLHPGIEIEFNVADRVVDLLDEQVDIAIRGGVMADSALIARKIFEMRRMICASPEYLAQHGTPQSPEDLRDHNCILMQTMPHLHRWPFRKGREITHVQTQGDIKTDNADVMFDLAIAGHGIIRMVDLQTQEAVDDGRLVPLLTSYHVDEPTPVWSVTPPGRQRIPRIRALIDFLVAHLDTTEPENPTR